MLTLLRLKEIAYWAADLTEEEADKARRGIVEKTYGQGTSICHRGDMLDQWTGVVDGLVRLGLVSREGKGATLAGMRNGVWFGEGSLLKNEPRRYDLVCLRDTRMALMNRSTFNWLFEHSAGFNRFLVRQFNERLGQFMGLAESDRTLDATGRIARNIAWLFNPVLYPGGSMTLEISQEELGLLAGVSRQSANRALHALSQQGLVSVRHNAITIKDMAKLSQYGS
ncbi:MAG: Crp/Fnr family transcriptional regulator [Beijerinckiaceae bacterium]